MSFKKEMLDALLKDYKNPEDIFGNKGTFKQLQKALLERILEGELLGTKRMMLQKEMATTVMGVAQRRY